MAFEQFLYTVNDHPNNLSSGFAKSAYAIFIQAPLNVLVKLSDLVTIPPAIFAKHMRINQRNTKEGFLGVKNRLALTLKLPFDILIGLIKVALFFPTFAIIAPLRLYEDMIAPFAPENKGKYNNRGTFASFLTAILVLALLIPAIALSVVKKVVVGKGYGWYYGDYPNRTDWSIFGALALMERSTNRVVSSVARGLVEIMCSPVTLGIAAYQKATAPSVDKAAAAKVNLNPQKQAPAAVTQTPVKEEATPVNATETPVLFSSPKDPTPELEEKSDLVESAASPEAPQRRRSSSSLSNV